MRVLIPNDGFLHGKREILVPIKTLPREKKFLAPKMNRLQKDNADRVISHVLFSAGGLIHRDTSSGPEVLIIHRSKYDDWSLPKGKLKERESFEEAAKALGAGEEKKQEGK